MKINFDESDHVANFADDSIYPGSDVENSVDYIGAVPDDFNEHFRYYKRSSQAPDFDLVLDDEKLTAAPNIEALQTELSELYEWFIWYDEQTAQYQRCLRLGEEFDEDITELDAQAKTKQLRIREIRATLEGTEE